MKEYTFNINGNAYNVVINSVAGDSANVTVNGVNYQVGIQNNTLTNVQDSCPKVATPAPMAEPAPVKVTATSGKGKTVNSPLPGVIVSVNVAVGDRVRTGQVIAVLEAMKMENEIQSEYDGIVTSVNVAKGDSILEGAAIVTIG